MLGAPVKVAFDVAGAAELNLTLLNTGTKLQRVLSFGPGDLIDKLVVRLRNDIRAAVARIGKIAAVDRRAASQQGSTIRIHDAQIRRDWYVVERRNVGVIVANVAIAEFVHNVC